MKSISHPNVIAFEHYFYKADDKVLFFFLFLERTGHLFVPGAGVPS